jgi:hypothetical protein
VVNYHHSVTKLAEHYSAGDLNRWSCGVFESMAFILVGRIVHGSFIIACTAMSCCVFRGNVTAERDN